MANITRTFSRNRNRSLIFAGLMVSVAIAMTGDDSHGESNTAQEVANRHIIRFPELQPSVAAGCNAEAAAYAAALVDLQAASLAADDAYNDWYACEYGGYGGKSTQSMTNAPSILVRD